LGFALLCKENIALIVLMIGVYLLLFERDWKWGAPLAGVGVAWALVVTLWVIPAFGLPDDSASLYPQLNYFGLAGGSYREIAAAVLRDPLVFIRQMFDRAGLQALWRVFLPVGFVMPFLAADWLLIVLPSMAYMLMSTLPGMHRLEDWYMASILPGFFAAVAVGLVRLPRRWAPWVTAGLLCSAAAGFALFSTIPPGARYQPELYQVTDHQRLAAEAIAAIPPDARVATQDPYVPHLTHREHIYLYPWMSIGEKNIDYLMLDRNAHPYPLQPQQMSGKIDDLIADTSYVIELEADGLYVFHRGGEPLPSFPVDAILEGTMRLDRVEVAVADAQGRFQAANREPVEVRRGQQVRVSLYWEALAAPGVERTVSVRIADASGVVAASYDNLPGQGKKPTSWWQKGWQIRDVYYLTLPSQTQAGQGSLDVLVYDTVTTQVVPFDGETQMLQLCDLLVAP
jgi:hypothetical protein